MLQQQGAKRQRTGGDGSSECDTFILTMWNVFFSHPPHLKMSLNSRLTDWICLFLGRRSWSSQGVLASPAHSYDDLCKLQLPLAPFDASLHPWLLNDRQAPLLTQCGTMGTTGNVSQPLKVPSHRYFLSDFFCFVRLNFMQSFFHLLGSMYYTKFNLYQHYIMPLLQVKQICFDNIVSAVQINILINSYTLSENSIKNNRLQGGR